MTALAIAMRLYSRPGCHLCDEMKVIVEALVGDFGVVLEEVDITKDPELESRYGQEIPVLEINGRKAFKYRLTERELRRRLRAEPRHA
jgi:glutaredoxin